MKVEQAYRVEARLAWWWRWLYVPGLYAMVLMGGEPDWGKIRAMAGRALRVRLVPVKSDEVQA
ncbi:MAG: hypothetical protein GX856_08675 [Gammaproteobacteria bacterium]|nr:hypothetical protein [Gammaproteobacteria bacterium]